MGLEKFDSYFDEAKRRRVESEREIDASVSQMST
jgi:hypothetical protein